MSFLFSKSRNSQLDDNLSYPLTQIKIKQIFGKQNELTEKIELQLPTCRRSLMCCHIVFGVAVLIYSRVKCFPTYKIP